MVYSTEISLTHTKCFSQGPGPNSNFTLVLQNSIKQHKIRVLGEKKAAVS